MGVLIVILFFAIDGIEKAVDLGHRVAAELESGPEAAGFAHLWNHVFDVHVPLLLGVLFDLLLAVMISLRTRAGRFWGVLYLVSLTGVGMALLVVEPARWLDFGTRGRVEELVTHAINLGLAGILLGKGARRTLVR
jgi:hypothetical protein